LHSTNVGTWQKGSAPITYFLSIPSKATHFQTAGAGRWRRFRIGGKPKIVAETEIFDGQGKFPLLARNVLQIGMSALALSAGV